jgi:hypothetical protein
MLNSKWNNKEKQMLKHVGRHGDRKVAIVFREIPNEDHMCLVIYPDVLPTHIHNSVMSVLESAPGQQSTNLADVFHRNLLPDGRNILQTLHKEGMLKKIATNQVILTPTPTSSVKLDEINRLVKEMESGEEALKRMKEIDQNQGIVAPEVKRQAESEYKNRQTVTPDQPLQSSNSSALDDKSLAGNMLAQARRMEAEAKGLISEAARMKKEAERMFPGVNLGDAKPEPVATPAPAKRGRPSKKVVADAAVQ